MIKTKCNDYILCYEIFSNFIIIINFKDDTLNGILVLLILSWYGDSFLDIAVYFCSNLLLDFLGLVVSQEEKETEALGNGSIFMKNPVSRRFLNKGGQCFPVFPFFYLQP